MNRLKMLRESKGKLQKDIASLLNISTSAYGFYETGKRDMSTDNLIKLAEYYGVTTDYILGKDENIYSLDTAIYVPVYGSISAGIPNLAEQYKVNDIPLNKDMIQGIDPNECFFLVVHGESMNQLIKNGSYALIHKQDEVENGDVAVILVDNYDATLKKFTKQGNTVILEPMSNDSSFSIQIYNETNNIKILGKYIGKFEIN